MGKIDTVFLFNNCFPSVKHPTLGTYVKTISSAIVDAGYNVNNVVLIQRNNKLYDYFEFYCRLLMMRIPRDVILYINHYTYLFPLIFRLFFMRRNLIIHWHGEELLKNGLVYKMLRYFMKKTFSESTMHISPSNYYKNVIISVLGVDSNKIVVSPSGGVNMLFFRERKTPNMDEIHIGFPAALNEHKGKAYLKLVIDNIQALENQFKKRVYVHVIKYGEDYQSFLEGIPKERSDRIIIKEKYMKEDIHQFYSNIHLSLFFSKRESLGLTVLESMACGVPVVARTNSSMPELVISGVSGELISNNPSFTEIEGAIEKIVNNITSYNPKQKAAEYSYEYVVTQYKSIIGTF